MFGIYHRMRFRPRDSTVPSVTENVVEDFKPATSNQKNKQFPAVNSQRMVSQSLSVCPADVQVRKLGVGDRITNRQSCGPLLYRCVRAAGSARGGLAD